MGRPKGARNRASAPVRGIARKLLRDKEYRANLLIRMRAGTAGPIESTMWYYGYGKPVEHMPEGNLNRPKRVIFEFTADAD